MNLETLLIERNNNLPVRLRRFSYKEDAIVISKVSGRHEFPNAELAYEFIEQHHPDSLIICRYIVRPGNR